MDWKLAARRVKRRSLEARLFATFRSLLADRASTSALHGGADVRVLTLPSPAILAFVRHHAVRGEFAMVANFGREPEVVPLAEIGSGEWRVVRASGAEVIGSSVRLPPMGYAWCARPGGDDGVVVVEGGTVG